MIVALVLGLAVTAAIPTEVVVKRPDCQLAGELLTPTGRAPKTLVVILAGSGPTDRDGNSKAGLRTNLYQDIAHALGERGLAVLRYDKRGVGKSTAPERPPLFSDFVEDARAFVDELAPRYRRVVVVGHSEGGLLALHLGKHPAVKRLVLLAATGRPLQAVLREQLATEGDAAVLGSYDRLVGKLLAGEPLESVPRTLEPIFAPAVQPFLRSVLAIDPVSLVKNLDLPIVVLQGRTDVQVKPLDAELLGNARAGVEVVLLDEANHLFRHEPKYTRRQRSYVDPTLPFAPGFLAALTKAIGK